MFKLLAPVLIWALTSAVSRILLALGIGLVTYTAIQALVHQFLDMAKGSITGLPYQILAILHLAGADQALSIIGGALLTRAAINAAKVSVGLAKK